MHTKWSARGRKRNTQTDVIIHDFIQSIEGAKDGIEIEGSTLHVLSGYFKTDALSIHCLSVLMRGIWKKHKIKTTGVIDGSVFKLDECGNIYECNESKY